MNEEQNIMHLKNKRGFQSVDQRLQYVDLALDVIEECRVQLMLKFRFLDRALWRMDLEKITTGMDYPLSTDGRKIYFQPEREVSRFRQSFEETVRDYLHLIMHCIFRHPFDRAHKSVEAWSLTCDIIVESVIMDLAGSRFPSEEDKERQNAISTLTLKIGNLLPGRLYDFLETLIKTPSGTEWEGLSRSDLNEWHYLFERDDHGAWPARAMGKSDKFDADAKEEVSQDEENPELQADGMQFQSLDDVPDEPYAKGSNVEGDDYADDDVGARGDDGAERSAKQEQDDKSNLQEEDSENSEGLDGKTQEEQPQTGTNDTRDSQPQTDQNDMREQDAWQDISKELEMNLSTFSKEWGDAAGALLANLQIANRRKYNYADFLRKFMTITEQIKLNLEEFDYTYYTFGMDLYGNMPFIEPLEYKEAESIRDFVIALDTSESVRGDLIKKFVEHTFNILCEARDASTRVNIHIVQTDARVQTDLKITNLQDIDKLMKGFTLRGFGGTDFRPTFDHIAMLQHRGEFANLKGMIYFTDGYGQFPEKVPDYDVAFIFIEDEEREIPPVPPWAMKVVLDEHDIEDLERLKR